MLEYLAGLVGWLALLVAGCALVESWRNRTRIRKFRRVDGSHLAGMVEQAIRNSVAPSAQTEPPAAYVECQRLRAELGELSEPAKDLGGLRDKWANPADPFWRNEVKVHELKLVLRGAKQLVVMHERSETDLEVGT